MQNSSLSNIHNAPADMPGIAPGSFPSESSAEIYIQRPSLPDLRHCANQDYQVLQSTSIDMEYPGIDEATNVASQLNTSISTRRNFLSLFREARNQFGRTSSLPTTEQEQQNHLHGHLNQTAPQSREEYLNYSQNEANHNLHSNLHSRNIRSWRMNLNNVLSFSTPSTEAIRSLITSPGTFRYSSLSSTAAGYNTHLFIHPEQEHLGQEIVEGPFHANHIPSNIPGRVSGNNLHSEGNGSTPQLGSGMLGEDLDINNRISSGSNNRNQTHSSTAVDNLNSVEEGIASTSFLNRHQNAAHRNTLQEDEDNNVISDMFIKVLSHFMRYLPFICIIFVKFVHDHLLGILDLMLLHGIMYQVNKSLRDQIAKFSQKSYGILFRDFGLVGFIVVYRFMLASSLPDPFGLLISPPANKVTLELTADGDGSNTNDKLNIVLSNILDKINAVKDQHTSSVDNTVTITKAISIGVLIYYVAVNDLILKLITIMVKISITLMPARVIRHKPRARMYVVVEYISQFYRSLAPLRQWLMFLFESYSGLDVISGVLFSSFYMGAKGFEFIERVKSLKKALLIFLHNMDYERKPTKDELATAGLLCPICHDTYSTPVVLECRHIFCDECVSTWFKREQTCPMCRAKVSEDPTWQDGSTTFFYQLC